MLVKGLATIARGKRGEEVKDDATDGGEERHRFDDVIHASGIDPGGADRLEAHVIDPEFADFDPGPFDPEVEGKRRGFGLGAEDLLDLDPPANLGECLLASTAR